MDWGRGGQPGLTLVQSEGENHAEPGDRLPHLHPSRSDHISVIFYQESSALVTHRERERERLSEMCLVQSGGENVNITFNKWTIHYAGKAEEIVDDI